ncbi:MAG: hybrid sensor histidine kinase/response regulator, partial [Isosphaeraceae bacterium]
QAEEELRHAKEVAELATRAKDDFLAVLSHELRTPLTPVLMAATAMLDNSRTCLSCRPTLAMIRDNILLEVRLIEDLLDVSRLGHGQMTYHFETVDVHALVERCVDICRHEHAAEHRLLEVDLGAFEHHVNGDPVRLQQVIWNLLTNATKYTSEGGRITIRTRSVARGYVTVEVEDDGIGIDPLLIPRVFEAFERGDGAALHHVRGLGLGLTLSRAIVEAHGGKLEAASEGRDRGARFTLELETIPKPSNGLDLPAPSTASASRPLRILLAEDNVVTAQVFAQVLGDKGHEVTTATCLRQALKIAYGDVDFDVVISDIDLTDGSGLDLMRLVRTRGDTPGIALSGYATKDDVRESAEAGFVAHLAKPVTLEMLESAIQNAVRQDGMPSVTLCSASRS